MSPGAQLCNRRPVTQPDKLRIPAEYILNAPQKRSVCEWCRNFSKTGWVLISDDLLTGWAASLSQSWQTDGLAMT